VKYERLRQPDLLYFNLVESLNSHSIDVKLTVHCTWKYVRLSRLTL